MIDIRQFRCFLAVAEELSFRAAAARLCVAQPALTRTIKRLEATIGASLFDRDTRNVRLTPIGKAFLVEARSALTQVERAERLARDMAQGRTGIIRIGYMSFLTHRVLGPVLKDFHVLRPDMRVELHSLGTEQQRTALVERTLDVAFLIGRFVIPGVATQIVREEEMMVIMPEDHELACRDAIRAADLQNERQIIGNSSLWGAYQRVLLGEFYRAGISPLISQEAPTPPAIISLVRAGMGLAILPKAVSLSYISVHDRLVLRPFVTPNHIVSTFCAWRTDAANASVETFVDCLRLYLDVLPQNEMVQIEFEH